MATLWQLINPEVVVGGNVFDHGSHGSKAHVFQHFPEEFFWVQVSSDYEAYFFLFRASEASDKTSGAFFAHSCLFHEDKSRV